MKREIKDNPMVEVNRGWLVDLLETKGNVVSPIGTIEHRIELAQLFGYIESARHLLTNPPK